MIVRSPLKPFNTISREEAAAAVAAIRCGPLSGYLGGVRRGGFCVEKLEREFADALGVKHAIACNSATSGLLMACMAADVGPGDKVAVPCFTMSATAAAPAFLGARIHFADIEDPTFCINGHPENFNGKAVIATNLFGHPALLRNTRAICDTKTRDLKRPHFLIEDNAQAPFAAEYAHYAGTVGHMGVFSFNVHKHLQAGEGGIVVTDDSDLADRLALARNHAEMASPYLSLNLRMTEVTAAIALAQLAKREKIITERIEIAETLTAMVRGLPGLTPPVVREGCRHVFYCWALKIDQQRDWFVQTMQSFGVPLRAGYVDPLYRLPAFAKYATPCPIAERMHDRELVLYENCAWSPTAEQLTQMGEAFKRAIDMRPDMG